MRTLVCALFSCLPSVLAQHPEPDADLAGRNPINIAPNSGSDYVPNGLVLLSDNHYVIQGNLVLRNGAQLRISKALVEVQGNVRLQSEGYVSVVDSTFHVKNTLPRQYLIFFEGGHLYTERAKIGGNKIGDQVNFTLIWLNRGLWEANDTTVEYNSGIMMGLIGGYNGDPGLKGGTLIARRLHQGETPDWVHMLGAGDAFIEDSTFNVALGLFGNRQAVNTTLDFSSRNTLGHIVYGDPAVHAGVTKPIAGSPWRIEMRNTRVPLWNLHLMEITNSGPAVNVTLDNAESVLCSLGGQNLSGSPVLVGDWSRYAGNLPGLPSTMAPGWHPIPMGAGVRFGNVTVNAGNSDAHVRTWALYLYGPGTNFTVNGPSMIVEIVLSDGRMNLNGRNNFDMGLMGATIDLHTTAVLNATNASVGVFSVYGGTYPLITAIGTAQCNLTNVRTNNLTMITGVENSIGNARITLDNAFTQGVLQQYPYPANSITVRGANQSQNTDLQNLGFESGIQSGGVPEFWAGQSLSQGSSGPARPVCGGGARSFRYTTSSSTGSLWKSLVLPGETCVDVLGFSNIQSAAGGQSLALRVSASGSVTRSGSLSGTATGWQALQVPPFRVEPGAGPVRVEFGNSPAGAIDALIDDFRIHIGNWWDNDNLANLDFEDPNYRNQGTFPAFWRKADFWDITGATCQPETSDRRPGTSGQRSMKITVRNGIHGELFKDLSFLQPGDRLTLTGWLKCIPVSGSTSNMALLIGEGNYYNTTGYGNNVRIQVPVDRAWHSFSVNYTVPCPPTKQPFTRINLHCFGSEGNVVFADDFTLSIR